MTVSSVTFWDDEGTPADQIIETGKKAKALAMKHGAVDFRMSQIFTGENTGKWVVMTAYADMAAYGNAAASAMADPDWQNLLANAPGNMIMRNLVLGVDLD